MTLGHPRVSEETQKSKRTATRTGAGWAAAGAGATGAGWAAAMGRAPLERVGKRGLLPCLEAQRGQHLLSWVTTFWNQRVMIMGR